MSSNNVPVKHRSIKFTYKGTNQEGTVINEQSGALTIKLKSGYNIVVDRSSIDITGETMVESVPEAIRGETVVGSGPGKVTIIATGGTISSKVDYTTGAVTPSRDISFLKTNVKDLEKRFTIDLESMDSILSENMTPDRWISIARRVKEGLDKSHGVIVSHGTDTMSYTAAAVSFLFEKQTGPIIFAGSQRSPDRPSSDAFTNIEAAIHFASAEMGDVGISMHEGESDSRVSLIRGTRSRKMHTSRRDAFKSIGEGPLAFYEDGSVVISRIGRRPSDENLLNDRLDPSVGIVYFTPTLSGEEFTQQCRGKKAVILMGTGLGHVADRLIEPIHKLTQEGIKIVMTSQCIYGSTNLNVYSTGRKLLDAGVITVGNMVPEVAYVKAMYVLANYDISQFESVMKTSLRGELLPKEEL